MPLHINIIAILVAMVANFIIQMVWYTALFSKSWSKEMGYDPNMRPDKKAMFKGYYAIVSFLFWASLRCHLHGYSEICLRQCWKQAYGNQQKMSFIG